MFLDPIAYCFLYVSHLQMDNRGQFFIPGLCRSLWNGPPSLPAFVCMKHADVWKWHLAPRLTVRNTMILVSLIFLVRTFLLKLVGSCEGWWTFAPGQGCSRVQRFANWRSSSPGAALVATIEVQRSYVFSPCVCTCILLIGTKVFAWLLTSLAAKFSIIYLLSFSFVHIHLSTVCSSVFPHHVEGIAFPPKNLVAGDVLNPWDKILCVTEVALWTGKVGEQLSAMMADQEATCPDVFDWC